MADQFGAELCDVPVRKLQVPSSRHQALVGLMLMFPERVLELVRPHLHLAYDLPGKLEFHGGATDVETLRLDCCVEYTIRSDEGDPRHRLVVIGEAQLESEDSLRWRIPAYCGMVRHRFKCGVAVLVICPTAGVANWIRRPIPTGVRGSHLRVVALGPKDCPPPNADDNGGKGDPFAAVLTGWYHTRRCGNEKRDPLLMPIVNHIIEMHTRDADKARDYYGYAMAILMTASAKRLEELMTIQLPKVESEWSRRHKAEGRAQGRAQGRAEGRAQDIVRILTKRRIQATNDQRKQILTCTDLDQLTTWLDRALDATFITDVLKPGDTIA
jgi:hypothetical protein